MRKLLILIAILTLAIIGCSGGSKTPLTPQNIDLPQEPTSELDNLPVIGATDYGDGSFSSVGLLGAYELYIDLSTSNAELIAKRTPTIGEDYIVSGIGFFTIAPCPDCLYIKSVSLDLDGTAILTFGIRHPFQPGNIAEDPTAFNRRDLNVFDLAAVVVPQEFTATTFSLMGADISMGFCAKADGYTTELANVTSTTGALPYFLVIDDNEAATNTYNEFAMGAEAEFDIAFDPSMPSLSFDLYLTMGYGASAKRPERLTPKYFNPEFNRKPAWKVVVIPPQGENPPAIGNTWQHNDSTTPFNVRVDVYDWQSGATVYADPENFADAPADNVYAVSEVGSVSVEISGMNNELQTVDTPVSGLGTPNDCLVYEVPIANENLLPVGVYMGLVKVTDTRVPLTPADGRDFLIDSPNGVDLIYYSINEYATYQVFPATVVLGCGPISGGIDVPAECPQDLYTTQTVDFVVSATSDNGGDPIILYEADYDYDGVTFTVDDSNTDGIFNDGGPFVVPDPCLDDLPYTYTVAFRASDSCDPTNVTIFVTCDVTISTCCIPPTPTGIDTTWFGKYPGIYDDILIDGSNFNGSGGVTAVYFDNGTTQVYATDIQVLSDTQLTCDFDMTTFSGANGTYDVVVETACEGRGVGMATLEDNILYMYNFADGDGGCTGEGTHGYIYCSSNGRWEDYNCSANSRNMQCSKLVTPPFDVPSYALDVHCSMRHSFYFEIGSATYAWDGFTLGWTDDNGTTFYGDRCSGNDFWKYESGQNYNYSECRAWYYNSACSGCTTYNGSGMRYFSGNIGTVGTGVWSHFHLDGTENLIGMTDAQFMSFTVTDPYVTYRGHEVYELIVWYDG